MNKTGLEVIEKMLEDFLKKPTEAVGDTIVDWLRRPESKPRILRGTEIGEQPMTYGSGFQKWYLVFTPSLNGKGRFVLGHHLQRVNEYGEITLSTVSYELPVKEKEEQ